jgi:hypothetical protein
MLEKFCNGEWKRPRTRNDLIERLMKFDWGTQLGILAYMRRFQTWDALYEDLRRRETGDSGIRTVSPIEPKQLQGATMRELTTHIVPGDSANHQLKIEVLDEPGPGNANHLYKISGFDVRSNPGYAAAAAEPAENEYDSLIVLFQNGLIKEVGVNGTTHEAELAILIDRLEGFQAGPYKTQENAQALESLRQALFYLQRRTAARIARGVEETHEK